jgi:hypothetical protein
MGFVPCLLRGGYLLVRLALVMTTDFDFHLLIEPSEKIQQFVGRKATEMPVHQVRNVGLCDPENVGNLPLLQFPILENSEHMNADLRTCIERARIFEPQVRKDVAGAPFELNWFSFFRTHFPAPVLLCSAA